MGKHMQHDMPFAHATLRREGGPLYADAQMIEVYRAESHSVRRNLSIYTTLPAGRKDAYAAPSRKAFVSPPLSFPAFSCVEKILALKPVFPRKCTTYFLYQQSLEAIIGQSTSHLCALSSVGLAE